jgi:hypothetical protein
MFYVPITLPALARAAFPLALVCALTLFCVLTRTAQAGAASYGSGNDSLSAADLAPAAAAAGSDTTGLADSLETAEDSLRVVKSATQRAVDSLKALEGVEEEAGVWRGPISFSTNYTLNRTTSNWHQNMGFQFSARGVSVSTTTSGTIYSDTETKSDRRNGNAQMAIDFTPTERLSVGLDISSTRLIDQFLRKRYDTNQVGARATYAWQQSDALTAKVSATAGSVDETKPTYAADGTSSALTFDSRFVFPVPCTLSVSASGQLNNKRSMDFASALKTNDQDLNEYIKADLAFNPLDITTMRLGFSQTNMQLQYPLFGRQETWGSKVKVASATAGVALKQGLSLLTDARYSDTQVDYAVDKAKSSSYLSKSATTQLNGLTLLGANITSRFDVDYANNVTGTGRNGDINTRTLSGRVQRGVSPLISADAIGSVSLTQYFFYDASSMPDERDIYKDALSLGLTLGRPGSRYTGSATVKRDVQNMVYIRSQNSGNSRKNELYSASASFAYKIRSIAFSQIATTTTDYTLFLFTESQDILSRTTSISSTMDIPWRERNSFRLSHSYRVQDNGPYKTPEGGGEKLYFRSGGSVTQELYLTATRKFANETSVSFGQRFQQNKTFRFLGGKKKWNVGGKVLEFLTDFRLKYALDKRSTINFTLSRTGSAFGRSYWNASASFSREFFYRDKKPEL